MSSQVDQGGDSRHDHSIAKRYGAIMANEIVDRMLQIHGGMGYPRELSLLLRGHASVRGTW